MTAELKPWLYVNGLMVRTPQALKTVVDFYVSRDETIEIEPVAQTAQGGYVLPLLDPMEC